MERTNLDIFSGLCGVIGWIGCLAALGCDAAGMAVVPHYNPISETISQLAIGNGAWIQSMGLDLFGAGVIACGLGLVHWKIAGWRWKTAAICLILIGEAMVVIAEHGHYEFHGVVSGAGHIGGMGAGGVRGMGAGGGGGGVGTGEGVATHIASVYTASVLFVVCGVLLSLHMRRIGRTWLLPMLALTILFIIAAPCYAAIPGSITGAYERFLAGIALIWFALLSTILIRRGCGVMPP